MQKILTQWKAFWAGSSRQQQVLLAAGVVLTLALVGVLAHTIATPAMKPLMTGLDPADAQTLAAALTAKGIPNAVSPDGKQVSVPADRLDAARMEAAASASAPHSGRMGFEIFDKMSWGETEFDEKVNYQRALEGELERTILSLSEVKSARVHLVMATDSVFLDQARGAKASVALSLRGAPLSRAQVLGIQRLVAGAVDNLKPADVEVIDADTNTALNTGSSEDGGDAADAEKQMEAELVATLAPVVGADHLHASVHVEYDPGTVDQSQEKYDPGVSVPLTVQRSDDETGAGAAVSGVAGAASNVPQGKGSLPNVPNVPGDGTESAKTENSTYGVNRTLTHTLEPAGRIRRVTAALLVDDATIARPMPHGHTQEVRMRRSTEELKQLQDLASAAIGLDPARGDVLTVEDMSFHQAAAVDVAPPSWLDRASRGLNSYTVVLRYGSLLALFVLAWALVLRPMQKRALAAPAVRMEETPLLTAEEQAQLAAGAHAGALGGADGLRSAALREQLVQLVKTEPQNSTRAVQAWLRGDAQ